MSNAEFTFRDRRIRQFLNNIDKNLDLTQNGARAFTRTIYPIVRKDVDEHFDKERGPDRRWPKWSQSYRKMMARMGKGGNKILQDTGKLKKGFKKENIRSVLGGLSFFNDEVTSEGFPYAKLHQEGGRNHPARPHMWVSDKALDKIAEATLRFIVD